MSGISAPVRGATSVNAGQSAPPVKVPGRNASDDEILGIVGPAKNGRKDAARGEGREFELDDPLGDPSGDLAHDPDSNETGNHAQVNGDITSDIGADGEPANLRPVFDANPELRKAWQDANA
jgi:hypothetical protein